MKQELKHQIVIIGGGAAGVTVASQLLAANSNLEVKILFVV
ncbi:hypothetical protein H1P_760015 [Hyella patelloides LEGE 07179]|uniref:Uncharacterized protein n=1 Tax=Hyella patelloides LEGE 07179 TaxID=945734 RepID=A0A563W3S8_9CYAN|nr:hypothetical protein [Hyella patelloides]VEP18349.1 hypothetical protein H1P_760015 [Hyella patelloides LEGE 07179]